MRGRLQGLEERTFDVAVIGGGIAGAGVARDAALRGLSVVLFEKGDFASGTSSKSSKLIHGGLRYLELFDFPLVAESLRERERLQRLAPHLVRPLPFLVPVYRGAKRGMIKVRVGMRLYDLLTPGKRTGRYRTLSAAETLRREPALAPEDLRGAGFYFDDLLLFPERLCLENVLSAWRHGARVLGHTEVVEFLREGGRLAGAWVRDRLTGGTARVRARVLVNAAGPWIDRVRALAGFASRRLLRTTKGIHILVPRVTGHAVYVQARDDRMFFVIPWRDFSLIGTTDTDYEGDLDDVWATPEEVAYLVAESRRVLPSARLSEKDIAYSYAGVRPLTLEEGKQSWEVSRRHDVIPEGEGGNFLSVTGTKLTCFRSQAEEAVNRIGALLGRAAPCRTHETSLDGADEAGGRWEARIAVDVSAEGARYGVEARLIERLAETYGRRYRDVLELIQPQPQLGQPLCQVNPEVAGQVTYAVTHELCDRLADFMLRRTGLGTSACLGQDCHARVAQLMAQQLGWDSRRLEAEIEAYHRELVQGQRFRTP